MTQETIPDYLARMLFKDLSKGYKFPGIRTTSEVAGYFGMKPAKARRKLDQLAQDGIIIGYERMEELPGRPYGWLAGPRSMRGQSLVLSGD
jgi:hypothetical protein